MLFLLKWLKDLIFKFQNTYLNQIYFLTVHNIFIRVYRRVPNMYVSTNIITGLKYFHGQRRLKLQTCGGSDIYIKNVPMHAYAEVCDLTIFFKFLLLHYEEWRKLSLSHMYVDAERNKKRQKIVKSLTQLTGSLAGHVSTYVKTYLQ